MEKKFNVGDRVMCTDNGALGVITSIDIDPIGVCDGYTVLFDDGEETWICVDMVVHSDEPIYDPKTAFLSDLAAVLRKHKAEMDIAFGDKCVGIMITISNEKLLLPISTEMAPASPTWLLGEYSHTPITADNIMDYDKE